MIKVKIYSIGKTKEPWLESALEEYHKRLSNDLTVEWKIVRDDAALTQALFKEKDYIGLDPDGLSLSSPELSAFVQRLGSRWVFVIGGPEGLPPLVRQNASTLLSFSKLTFTHQITRLILLEQLYRCIQIEKGTKYHK